LSPGDASERLREIEKILSHRRAVTRADSNADAVAVHLADVPSVRIKELTAALRRRCGETVDEIDAVAMRLLLADYSVAVMHLRAVARDSASRIDGVAGPLKTIQRAARLHDRRDENIDPG